MMQLRTHRRSAAIRSNFLGGFVLILVWGLAESLPAQSNWKEEWEKTLRAAEVEGHLTLMTEVMHELTLAYRT